MARRQYKIDATELRTLPFCLCRRERRWWGWTRWARIASYETIEEAAKDWRDIFAMMPVYLQSPTKPNERLVGRLVVDNED